MRRDFWIADGVLLVTALIWGLAFVAQRYGMQYTGPFMFNGIRFLLGALTLLPVVMLRGTSSSGPSRPLVPGSIHLNLKTGLVAGLLLFGGASLQQVGIVYTTAGNAGFITGLYVVIVPFILLITGKGIGRPAMISAILAVTGLYMLTGTKNMYLATGDGWVLGSAFFWAFHLLYLGKWASRVDFVLLAMVQYMVCGVMSLTVAFLSEVNTWQGVREALIPILYGGIMSVGIGYTLQIYGQRKAPTSHAAILLSLESVFAAAGGWAILNEMMNMRQISGCLLMLTAIVLTQIGTDRRLSPGERELRQDDVPRIT